MAHMCDAAMPELNSEMKLKRLELLPFIEPDVKAGLKTPWHQAHLASLQRPAWVSATQPDKLLLTEPFLGLML